MDDHYYPSVLQPKHLSSLHCALLWTMGVIGCSIGFMLRSDTIQITPEILGLIARIDEFKGAWRALGTLAPDRLSALRRVATIESIGSSTRIEGSKLSDREVERLAVEPGDQVLRHPRRAGSGRLRRGDGSGVLVLAGHPVHREPHQAAAPDLLRYSEKDAWHRGNYKTSSNSVAAFDENGAQIGIVFETATPFDTPRLMTELVTWMQEEREAERLHPLLLIALFVVVFLEIHPFQDGNGRLSRVLTTLLLLQAGYAYVPYSSLESVIEQNKEAYYLALRQTQGTIRTDAPNWQPWLVFFLRSLAEQVRRLEQEGRARETGARLPAGAVAADRRVRPRARPRHDRRRHQADRRQPQHPEATLPGAGRARPPEPARQRPGCLVRAAVTADQSFYFSLQPSVRRRFPGRAFAPGAAA